MLKKDENFNLHFAKRNHIKCGNGEENNVRWRNSKLKEKEGGRFKKKLKETGNGFIIYLFYYHFIFKGISCKNYYF